MKYSFCRENRNNRVKKVFLQAPAKINLFLKILNKRPDGYHNLETVFEKVSLCDEITLKEYCKDEIVIKTDGFYDIPLGPSNLIHRVVSLVKNKLKIKQGLHIYLKKNIPPASGLGGASSDAAAVLKGINDLWDLKLNHKELFYFAQKIGSDVPLFLFKENFLAGKGKGEKIKVISVPSNFKLWHILIFPDFGVETHKAYSLFDRERLKLTIPDYDVNIIIYALLNNDVSLLDYYSYNNFEPVIYKAFLGLGKIRDTIQKLKIGWVHLSGSGSTLFMTFSFKKEAQQALERILGLKSGYRASIVNTSL